ncbi:D-alanyl-D-alanine carboxypeptidase (penicillin-binding protein 5/6) [Roseovarius halotolerans]|uniref:serine-type D-Ala-D-Ala carboxypeptidase n=1 Tax=Roseovarius halotolerans TaxID=505353 RepID=A0A1X6YBN3_9RHOB|nr:D-alanyl-D-alanine carboxypeptidase family protein [Roseovarius halotolerans]RKT34939.1 D-alanyl-D-alanine carboxypeptidase (penicillin-binding protein 5/6) [Roseovarius halotolerans]SLN16515.1 D-alanyl-D-alanine carboxypeptidase DacC precursor [Roseovarius halotolerans]
MTRLFRLLTPVLLVLALALPAAAFDTRAKAAFVFDMKTGTVLLDKNADEPLPPASMSKLMTLYVAFEAIRDGRLSLDERLPVSQHAMSYGGSTMFLDTTDRVRVEDLLRGIIVLSGNDACAVLAEALSPDGTEAGFARYMTQRAQRMGMTNSTFINSNGWPAAGHRMSVRDLALLARRIIEDFPGFYPMFSETRYEFDGRAPQNTRNRNPLLALDIGADGLKTGHTQEAGYGLVGSAKQGDRRVVFVISGIDTQPGRAEEAEAIVNWAFRQFVEKSVLKAGTEVARADVWMGDMPSVGLTPAEDISTLMPVLASDDIKAEVVYQGPIRAPVKAGDALAELVFAPEGLPETRVPLVAAQDVPRGGFMARIRTVSGLLVTRLRQESEDAI